MAPTVLYHCRPECVVWAHWYSTDMFLLQGGSENAGWQSGGDGTLEQHLIGFLQLWLTLGRQRARMPREKKPFLGTGLQHTGEWAHTNNTACQKSFTIPPQNVQSLRWNPQELGGFVNRGSEYCFLFLFLSYCILFVLSAPWCSEEALSLFHLS